MNVLVDIAAAVICFAGACHPALVGTDTPRGTFRLERFTIEDPRYGGDLLVFDVQDRTIYAIHRLIEVPGQRRKARLESQFAAHRNNITGGCVNVTPKVYQQLAECCSNSDVIIK